VLFIYFLLIRERDRYKEQKREVDELLRDRYPLHVAYWGVKVKMAKGFQNQSMCEFIDD
jgi:hypothetical protein